MVDIRISGKDVSMNTVRLLSKISIKYWKTHRMRLAALLGTIAIGTAALNSAALLIRSEKSARLEDVLRIQGNYDVIVYDLEESMRGRVEELPEVTAVGSYAELGYVSVREGAEAYKAASFDSREDEEMYHMTCIYGHYPTEPEEVALDLQTAKAMGIKPVPGERAEFLVCDLAGEPIGTGQYVVSGFFETSANNMWGGWYRYPYLFEVGEYSMPAVFFHRSVKETFHSDRCVVFAQTEGNITELACKMLALFPDEIQNKTLDSDRGRTHAYSYITGVGQAMFQLYDKQKGEDFYDQKNGAFQNILTAIRDGNVIKDFYSGILIPVFNALIFVVAFVSVFGIVGNVVNDKRELSAILRSVGLSGRLQGIYILADILTVAAAAVLAGLGLGCLIHPGMLWILKRFFGMSREPGFVVSPYVAAVTADPYWYPVLIMLFCVLLSGSRPIWRFVRKTPAELLQPAWRKHRRVRAVGRQRNWRRLISRRMKLFDRSVAVIFGILMGAVVFGYTYFHALADKEASSLRYERESAGLKDLDYVAIRGKRVSGNLENGHDLGVSAEVYEQFAAQSFVAYSFAEIVNLSTVISYERGVMNDGMTKFLAPFSVRYQGLPEEGKSEYENAKAEAEQAILGAAGYRQSEDIYALPTIAFDEELLAQVEERIVEGTVDRNALEKGEKVLLAVPEYYREAVFQYFPVGSVLPLSDTLLDKEEEQIDFNNISAERAEKHIVYNREVPLPELGEDARTPVIAVAFGKRKDIRTEVGAIAVLDEEFLQTYFPAASDYYVRNGEGEHGVYAVCGRGAFACWGLPDRKYTKVGARLTEGCDTETADQVWYATVGAESGLEVYSTKEILDRIRQQHIKNMSTFYLMTAMLTLTGLLTSAVCLYSRIRLLGQPIAYLRAVGMRRRDMVFLLLRNNLKYPVFGLFLSLLPTALCQGMFLYIQKMINTGVWEGMIILGRGESPPWWLNLPFWYNLFEYLKGLALPGIFAIYAAVVLAATVPQILYLKKQRIAGEFEINLF